MNLTLLIQPIRRLPWLATLLVWLLSLAPRPGQAQVHYSLSDGGGATALDQLRSYPLTGGAEQTIVGSSTAGFPASPGAAAYDAANNRLLVLNSFNNSPYIAAVNLSTNAVTTFLTPAAISGSASTTFSGTGLAIANGFVYYSLSDGGGATALDQLRSYPLAGGAETTLVTSNTAGFPASPGAMAYDAANNRLLVLNSFNNSPYIAAVNLSTNAVTTFLTAAAISGSASTTFSGTGLAIASGNVYYGVSDAGVGTLDQLRRVPLAGGAETILVNSNTTNFPASLGAVALDAVSNRLLVLNSFNNSPSIAAVNLSTNAVTTFLTPAAISGSASTTFSGTGFVVVVAPTTVTSINRVGATPTNASSVSYTVTFGASVTGVSVGNFSLTTSGLTGASITSVSGSGTTYTVTVNTGTGSGTLQLNLANATGLNPTVSNVPYAGQAFTIDKTDPTVAISSATASGGTVSTTPLSFTATFSEGVTGFAAADITVTNGTVTSGPTGSGTLYTFQVTPTTPGTVTTATIVANAAQDAATNGNTASATYSLTYVQPVTAAPVVTTPANGSLLNTATPAYTGTAVANSTVTVYVDGTAIGTTTATAGGSFSLNQPTALAQGSHTVRATAQSSGSAVSVNSNTNTFTVDTVQPTVVISSSAGASGSTTSTSPIPFTITFSEGVTGFVTGDVTVSNGTLSGFAGSGATYTFNVTPAANGVVTVNVPANVAQDGAGNGNTAATQFSITYSQPVTAAPVVTTPPNVSLTNTRTPTYLGTAVANSTVTVYVDGTSIGTTTATAGGSFALNQPTNLADGTHVVYATAQTSGSAVSVNSNVNGFTVDATSPTVSITSSAGAAGSTTSTVPIPFTITFSESVTGFVVGDVTVSNGTISGFIGSGTTYTFNVTPTANGVVTVNVPANVAQDAAGNGNTAATQFSITYNLPVTTAPVVTTPANGSLLNTRTPTYSGTAPAGSTVTVYVDGSSIGTDAATSGTFSLTQPTNLADGSHSVRATAQLSGQGVSLFSNSNAFTIDATAPTVVITSTAGTSGSTTPTSPIPFTITFSEGVTGFVVGDVTVSNGTISGFSGSGTTYTFNVTPAANGVVTVNVAANVAQDAAGNGNTAATQFSITYSQLVTAAPVVIAPANGSLTATRTPAYSGTAVANSTVTVYVDGISIGTTTATAGGSFTLNQPTNLADGAHTVYATAQTSGSAVSANSNTNTFTVDATAPTVAISSTATSPTSTSPIPVTVTFSEGVTGFVIGDVTVSNGTISGFSGSGTTYTFSVTPAANGVVTVNVPANVAQDAAGNGNTAATQFSITYSQLVTAAPVVTTPANGSLLNTATPAYSGTAVANSTVTVYVDGTAIGTTTATAGGSFSLVQPTALAQGSHTVRATAQTSGSAVSANSNTNTFTVDTVAPTVAITSTATSPTSTSPIPVTVTFSEGVTGFVTGDITVTNGTISGFSGSGTTYTFSVTPTGTSLVTVNVPANVAQDAAGNGNTAATQFSIQYNVPTATVAAITRNTPSPAATTTVSYSVAFSGAVSGVSASNFALTTTGAISGAGIGSVSGSGATYTVVVNTGSGDGTLRLDVANATGISPSVTNTPYTSGPVYTITKTFANPVLTIQGTGGTSGSADVTAFVDVVQVVQAATSIVVPNAVGNPSFETYDPLSSGNYGYSPTGASWTFNPRSGISQNGSAFNSPTAPDGIAVGGVQSTTGPTVNGSLQQGLGLTNGSYQVSFLTAQRNCCSTVMDQGLNVFVNGTFVGSITPANNGIYTNFTSSPFTVTAVSPTVAITSTATNPTSTSPIPVTVTFSESVTGFSAAGVTVSNGTLSGFTGSGTTYTFNVTSAGTGLVTVNVAANAAQNGVGTGNAAAPQFSIQYNAPITATTWTGATSTDWFNSANWTAGVPTTTIDATIPAGQPRYPSVSAGTATARNLTLASGATLTQGGGTISLLANFSNSGTFAATSGSVNLSGSTSQTIGGSSTTSFWNLTVGTAGAALAAPMSMQRVLTLTGNLATSGQACTLLSAASGTALVVNNGGVVTGAVTVQRYIDPSLNAGPGYRHYSSPVQATTVADLSTAGFSPVLNAAYNTSATPYSVVPFPTVFGYDQARLSLSNNVMAFDKGWFSPAAASDALALGRGYTVNIGASELVDFVGTLTNGDQSPLALSRNAGATAAEAGWQLLGNPYPAPLDYSLVAPADRTNLDGAMYVFASTSQYGGQYRSYVNGIGGNPVVPVAQGFFVRVSAGQSSGSLTFRNSQRQTTPNATAFQRGTLTDTRPQLQLGLRGAGTNATDDTYVYFEAGATAGVDAQYDAVKLPNSTGLNLSTTAAGTELAINGLPVPSASPVTVPLTVRIPVSGTYTLSVGQLANFGAGSAPVLHDWQLGTFTDLSQQPTYTFTLNATSTTPRFELVFGRQALATVSAALAAQVGLYPNPAHGSVVVELPAALRRQAVPATLVDALGRVAATQVLPAGRSTHTLPLGAVATGLYLLRLQTEAGLVVKKLVVE